MLLHLTLQKMHGIKNALIRYEIIKNYAIIHCLEKDIQMQTDYGGAPPAKSRPPDRGSHAVSHDNHSTQTDHEKWKHQSYIFWGVASENGIETMER